MNSSSFLTNSSIFQYLYATNYADCVVRVLALGIHILYVLLVIYFKDLRNRLLLYVHHVNFTSLLYCLIYVLYINSDYPNFKDAALNQVLCSINELAWISLRFLREYSLFLLAIYRYLSVYKIETHRRLTNNLTIKIGLIMAVWSCSIGIGLGTKYIFGTTYSKMFCFDGNSDSPYISFGYTVTIIFLSFVLPCSGTIILHAKIIKKLHKNTRNLNKHVGQDGPDNLQKINLFFHRNVMKLRPKTNIKKHSIAHQLKILNMLTIVDAVFSSLVFVQLKLEGFFDMNEDFTIYEFFLQPVFRMFYLLAQAAFPVVSIWYGPLKIVFFKDEMPIKFAKNKIFH